MNLLEGVSIDIVILSRLYREPMKTDDIAGQLPGKRKRGLRAAVMRLLKERLIADIHKSGNAAIYKLTRKGQQFLEEFAAKRVSDA
jgi:DNA-binding PadR family transcriptional regulator